MNAAQTEARMPFLEHVRELRSCMLHSIAGVSVAAVLCLYWAGDLFEFICSPLRGYFPDAELIGTGPAEAFIVKLKVALTAGILLASPYIFYQLWRFIAPGLYEKERSVALPFVLASTCFFLTGVAFCFFVVFPFAFNFFGEEFASISVTPTIRVGEYLSFAVKLLVVFGILFEMPIFSYFLAKFGLLTHTWLLAQFRYATVIIFIVAAILTPPDVITQILLAIPMMILYGLCIVVAYYVAPPKTKAEQQPPPSLTPVVGSESHE